MLSTVRELQEELQHYNPDALISATILTLRDIEDIRQEINAKWSEEEMADALLHCDNVLENVTSNDLITILNTPLEDELAVH